MPEARREENVTLRIFKKKLFNLDIPKESVLNLQVVDIDFFLRKKYKKLHQKNSDLRVHILDAFSVVQITIVRNKTDPKF